MLPGAQADIFLLEQKNGLWQQPIHIATGPFYEFDPTIDAAGRHITYAEAVPGAGEHIYATACVRGIWQTPANLTRGVTSGFRPCISGNGTAIVYYGTGNVEGVTDVDNEIYVITRRAYSGSIAGRVISANDAALLSEVLVTAEPGQYMTKTDSEGVFELRVPRGTYTVIARKNCFAPATMSEITVRPGHSSTG